MEARIEDRLRSEMNQHKTGAEFYLRSHKKTFASGVLAAVDEITLLLDEYGEAENEGVNKALSAMVSKIGAMLSDDSDTRLK